MVEGLLSEMPKNYQIWNFRRRQFCIGRSSAPQEIAYAAAALEQDQKNYHAWSHRQAVQSKVGDDWISEMRFVDLMLEEDLFNNSAWTQRSWILQHLPSDQRLKEIDFTMECLRKAPHCTAAWNFLHFLMHTVDSQKIKSVLAFCHEILQDQPHCLPCLESLAEIYAALARSHRNGERFRTSCLKIWDDCAKIDPIRRHYWTARQSSMQ